MLIPQKIGTQTPSRCITFPDEPSYGDFQGHCQWLRPESDEERSCRYSGLGRLWQPSVRSKWCLVKSRRAILVRANSVPKGTVVTTIDPPGGSAGSAQSPERVDLPPVTVVQLNKPTASASGLRWAKCETLSVGVDEPNRSVRDVEHCISLPRLVRGRDLSYLDPTPVCIDGLTTPFDASIRDRTGSIINKRTRDRAIRAVQTAIYMRESRTVDDLSGGKIEIGSELLEAEGTASNYAGTRTECGRRAFGQGPLAL